MKVGDGHVSLQNDLSPPIGHRLYAFSHMIEPGLDLFQFYDGNYDYILADSTSEQSILRWSSGQSLERLESDYEIYAQGDGVYLFKKGYSGEPFPLGGK